MSICSIEDIAEATGGHPFWFQLYVMKDRGFIERLIDRAKAAKCDALVLTLDLQILGQRHKDLKNGLSAPPKLTLPNILKATTTQLAVFKPAALGVDVSSKIKTLKVSEPPKRGAGIKVPDVATLVDKLKNEAKVI
jgi:isopentenyl diphosphate isomerase/L-lactate dehydrogenase-like FMN-dependent dehydrogenase